MQKREKIALGFIWQFHSYVTSTCGKSRTFFPGRYYGVVHCLTVTFLGPLWFLQFFSCSRRVACNLARLHYIHIASSKWYALVLQDGVTFRDYGTQHIPFSKTLNSCNCSFMSFIWYLFYDIMENMVPRRYSEANKTSNYGNYAQLVRHAPDSHSKSHVDLRYVFITIFSSGQNHVSIVLFYQHCCTVQVLHQCSIRCFFWD